MLRLKQFFIMTIAMASLLPLTAAHAILEIEITQSANIARPIAIVPFEWQGTGQSVGEAPLDVASIVAADLARSGKFRPLDRADMLETPSQADELDLKNWRILGVNHVVIGRVLPGQGSQPVIEFQVFDVYSGEQVLGYRVPVPAGNPRRGAHHVSDLIYETLIGEPGAFRSRIAFINATRENGQKRYSLMVADADGYNQQAILRSDSPLMSPVWGPKGERLAYVSFENDVAEIYIQNLRTGQRTLVASRPGINGAPVFSPDGSRMAMVLSSEPGNPDIYVKNLGNGELTRLTKSQAIDTEPAWTPNGESLLFTSDRGGGPQIYRMAVNGSGEPRRVTYEGSYNASPEVSADGTQLALLHRGRSGYHIAVMDMRTGALRVLTEGALDESPSFAPNGSMILYATDHNGKGVLASVSTDGRTRTRLASAEGDVREPAWSPLLFD